MLCADQIPIRSTNLTMRWHKWVILIAGSTGSALRAVPTGKPVEPPAPSLADRRASWHATIYRPNPEAALATLAVLLCLHILSAVVWVGGMFAAYMCLRPAAGALEPPQRLRLWRAFFQKFFPWVWAAVLLLLVSGYWMLITTFGGFAGAPLYINLMQALAWVMIALFVWLFHGPWLAFKRAVDAQDWPAAAAHINCIRQIIMINLPLGLVVIAVGGTGRLWG